MRFATILRKKPHKNANYDEAISGGDPQTTPDFKVGRVEGRSTMSNVEPKFAQLLTDPEYAQALPRDQCAALLAKCKALEGRLLAQLFTDATSAPPDRTSGDSDRLLTITQTAALLSVSKSYLYHNAARLGLARKIGDGTLRFSFSACQKLMKTSTVSRSRGATSRGTGSV